MKKTSLCLFVLITLFMGIICSNFVFGSEMKISQGVQISAMGGAGTSLVREESVYYNSAAVAFLTNPSLSTSWQNQYDFINRGQIIGIIPFCENKTLGIFNNYYSTKGIDSWDEFNNRTSTYKLFSNLAGLSLGWKLMDNLSVGGALKYLSSDTKFGRVASDVSGDVSAFTQYKKVLNIGVSAQNIGDKQDGMVKAGVSIYEKWGKLSSFPTTLSLGLNYPFMFKPYFSFGMETFFYSTLYVRLGYRTGPLDLERLGYLNGLTFGFGVELSKESNWQLDYAFVPNGDLGDMHQVGLGYKFGKKLNNAGQEENNIEAKEESAGQIEEGSLFDKGLKLIEEGDLLEAVLVLEDYLKINPESKDGKTILKETELKLDKEIALEGRDSMIFTRLKKHYLNGIEEYRKRNFEKSGLAFEEVLKNIFHPKSIKYLEYSKKRLNIQDNKNQARIYLECANDLIKEGKYCEAEEKVKKSLELYPGYMPAKELLKRINPNVDEEQKIKKYLINGEKKFYRNEYEKALMDFYYILRINPENQKALEMSRKCALNIIKKDKIEKVSVAMRKKYVAEGNTFYKENDYNNAIYQWSMIIADEPNNIDILKKITGAYRKIQKESREKNKQQLLLEKNKKEIEEYIKKAEEFYQKSEYNYSIEYWEKILALDPDNQTAKEGLDKAGKKLERGASEEANPDVVEKYYKQGLIYYNQGNYQDAVIEWKKVLELVPDHEKAKANIKTVEEKIKVKG